MGIISISGKARANEEPINKPLPSPLSPLSFLYVHSPQRQLFCKMSIQSVKLKKKKDKVIEIFWFFHPPLPPPPYFFLLGHLIKSPKGCQGSFSKHRTRSHLTFDNITLHADWNWFWRLTIASSFWQLRAYKPKDKGPQSTVQLISLRVMGSRELWSGRGSQGPAGGIPSRGHGSGNS